MGNSNKKAIEVFLKLNGQDVNNNNPIIVDQHSLFQLVEQDGIENGLLELTASDSGLEAYAFTFGK